MSSMAASTSAAVGVGICSTRASASAGARDTARRRWRGGSTAREYVCEAPQTALARGDGKGFRAAGAVRRASASPTPMRSVAAAPTRATSGVGASPGSPGAAWASRGARAAAREAGAQRVASAVPWSAGGAPSSVARRGATRSAAYRAMESPRACRGGWAARSSGVASVSARAGVWLAWATESPAGRGAGLRSEEAVAHARVLRAYSGCAAASRHMRMVEKSRWRSGALCAASAWASHRESGAAAAEPTASSDGSAASGGACRQSVASQARARYSSSGSWGDPS
jgi:hypothetical protein